MISARKNGQTRGAGAIAVRKGGVTRQVARVYLRTAAGLKEVWAATSPVSANAFPPSSFGATADPGNGNIQTSAITISATGGVPPYIYAGVRIDANTGAWSLLGTGPEYSFLARNVPANVTRSAVFRFTVTDSQGNVAPAVDVPVDAENYGGLQ